MNVTTSVKLYFNRGEIEFWVRLHVRGNSTRDTLELTHQMATTNAIDVPSSWRRDNYIAKTFCDNLEIALQRSGSFAHCSKIWNLDETVISTIATDSPEKKLHLKKLPRNLKKKSLSEIINKEEAVIGVNLQGEVAFSVGI
ncbi:hypothetical protein ILUMI_04946 [Ignelater luminosus]|uniref:Uncharacterized protein n=1 Tax=Ignelater luminosus TaxID=2038154 RepID=A0A8K0D8P1_IGNLU|nr:hypothetical protein ILUMI_04946 [Ignelater luminosus]